MHVCWPKFISSFAAAKQPDLAINTTTVTTTEIEIVETRTREFLEPRPHAATEEELSAHESFLAQINDPLWKRNT